MSQEILGYNIVILPSDDIKRQAIQWSTHLSNKFSTTFTLDGNNYHPHMTLYQSNFPNKNYNALVSALALGVKYLKPFRVSFRAIRPYANFIFYHAINNPHLQTLHEKMIDILNPLRDPNFSVSSDLLVGFPEHFKEYATKYGYVLAHDEYLPHITISRVTTQEEANTAATSLSQTEMTMDISAIHLTNVDHDDTCTNILKTFEFV